MYFIQFKSLLLTAKLIQVPNWKIKFYCAGPKPDLVEFGVFVYLLVYVYLVEESQKKKLCECLHIWKILVYKQNTNKQTNKQTNKNTHTHTPTHAYTHWKYCPQNLGLDNEPISLDSGYYRFK